MAINIEKKIRDIASIGVNPYRQIHAHSTGNPSSTAQNEADYMMRRPLESGYFTHVVGNGRVIQTAHNNRGAYDVGGGWNYETYAAVELLESQSTQEEFLRDYRLYIELLRQLADEAGIPKTLDSGALEGIKTHWYCTNNQPNNHSDHVDPLPFLAKWGVTYEQFKRDVEKGLGGTIAAAKNKKKEGNVMLLFSENGTVYWLVGNKYTGIANPSDLKAIETMMAKAGYDTWIHTNKDQIKYIKRIAEPGK